MECSATTSSSSNNGKPASRTKPVTISTIADDASLCRASTSSSSCARSFPLPSITCCRFFRRDLKMKTIAMTTTKPVPTTAPTMAAIGKLNDFGVGGFGGGGLAGGALIEYALTNVTPVRSVRPCMSSCSCKPPSDTAASSTAPDVRRLLKFENETLKSTFTAAASNLRDARVLSVTATTLTILVEKLPRTAIAATKATCAMASKVTRV
mmetsp:Transcript_36488/g.58600  ORF Transcript_36488/g.58600 Transcript_36488/m.58600 type:complete len:209 (+) Transcript_36488:1242-1868(+)